MSYRKLFFTHVTFVLGCVLVSSVWGASLGCGGSSAQSSVEVPRDAAPPDPLALLPPDSFLVLRIDLERVRRSPYYETLIGWFVQLSGSQDPAAMHDFLGRASTFVVALREPSAEQPPEIVMVARGGFRPGELAQFVGGILEQQGSGPASVRVERRPATDQLAYDVEVVASAEANGAALGNHTWLVSVGGNVDAILARARGRAALRRQLSGEMTTAAQRGGFEQGAVGLVFVSSPNVQLALDSENSPLMSAVARSLKSLGAQLNVDSGINLAAIATMTNEEAAQSLAGTANRELQAASGNLVLAAMGLRDVISSVRVRANGSQVLGDLAMTDAQTRDLLMRLSALLALSGQSDGALEIPQSSTAPQP